MMRLSVLFVLSHTAAAVTPTQKVIQLLSDLRTRVADDGNTEATSYGKFSCFCKDKSTDTSNNIKSGSASIDTLSASIAADTATKADKSVQLKGAGAQREKLETDLKGTQVRCEQEMATYQTNDVDLVRAITTLEKARKSMEDSKAQPMEPGLLSVASVVSKNPDVEAAMRLISEGTHWVGAFLQQQSRSRVDPSDPSYKFHSQDILDVLAKLHTEFTDRKAEADAEWGKTKESCDKTKEDLQNELDQNEDLMLELRLDIEQLVKNMGGYHTSLVEADAQLKDDKLYLSDLTTLCEKRANEFDQRSDLRRSELEALTQALEILNSVVSEKEAVNERAMFLQTSSFLQRIRTHRRISAAERGQELAIEWLRSEGNRLSSALLSSLVAQYRADPFGKVKELIQQLLERLLAESTNEATKKHFCDTELRKAEQDRDFRHAEALELVAELGQLKAKRESLEVEMSNLGSNLEELAHSLEESASQREEDRTHNTYTLKEATDGIKAVTDALIILKEFYKSAAKAGVAAIQLHASPVDEHNPGAGFEGAYVGQQADSKGIIGLLEVIKSDFERTISTTEASEKETAAEFVQFQRDGKTAESGKSTKLTLDSKDQSNTVLTIESKMKDLKTSQDLLDMALRKLVELKPVCIDNVQTYEERVAERDKEIEALKKAVCLLDSGVEEMCKQ